MMLDNGITMKNLQNAIDELRKGEKITSVNAEGNYNALEKYAKNLNF